MKKLTNTKRMILAAAAAAGAVVLGASVLYAAPAPPPPPPPVPAESLFTEYLAGAGMAGYGVWVALRARRARRKDHNQERGA